MKKLRPLLILIFASSLFGQAAKTEDPKAELFSTKNWSRLTGPTESSRGFALFSRDIRENGSGKYQLWVKIVPSDTGTFNKRHNLPADASYVLQYASVDCGKKLLIFEKTTVYDSREALTKIQSSAFSSKSKRGAVKPGSIGEALYESVCVKP